MDAEDGALSDAALRWSLDGAGIGADQQTLEGLAPGEHTITLTARDAAGAEQATSVKFTVAPLVIPHSTMPTLDGDCNDEAYASAPQTMLAPYSDAGQASVQLIRTDDALWACFSGMKRVGGTSPGTTAIVRVDTDNSRDVLSQAKDYEFWLGEDGVPNTLHGTGEQRYDTPKPGGLTGRVSANDTSWNAEMRIDATAIGGLGHVVGLNVAQVWVNSPGDDYNWPHRAIWFNPSTWATTALGDVSQINTITPNSAPAGSRDTTITIDGSNFVAGAVAQWNDVALATTVISSTQIQAVISAENLAIAGTVHITIVNPGLEATPSDSKLFNVTNPIPSLAHATLTADTLTVQGGSFVASTTLLWNGVEYPAAVVNDGQLQVKIAAADLVGVEDIRVIAFNPGPGGGVSNMVPVTVSTPGQSVTPLYLPLVQR